MSGPAPAPTTSSHIGQGGRGMDGANAHRCAWCLQPSGAFSLCPDCTRDAIRRNAGYLEVAPKVAAHVTYE